MRLFFTLFLAFTLLQPAQAQVYTRSKKGPVPAWVQPVSAAAPSESLNEAGAQLLLFDRQQNIQSHENYLRQVVKLTSSEGVQENSDLSVNFDPSYSQLTINALKVHRDGEILDRLADQIVNEMQRESSLERSLYDGSITAVLNLSDIRKGDVIEFAYTIRSEHPAFPGHFFSHQRLQSDQPIGRLSFRVLCPAIRTVDYQLYEAAPEPQVSHKGGYKIYHWQASDIAAAKFYQDAPDWYDHVPRVALSNFQNWQQVVKSVIRHYQYSAEEMAFLKKQLSYHQAEERDSDKLLSLVQFVQDEIRYLGFENGLNAFKPHSPIAIVEQRYGDCKDKSHLLVGLLRAAGAEAYPMLVNTYERRGIKDSEISPFNFDHCIVALRHHNQWVYIDPTISNQGGRLADYRFPDYGKGLLLKPGEDSLRSIANRSGGKIELREEIELRENNLRPSSFRAYTTYSGSEADNIREFFLSNSRQDITEAFVDYYRSIYPHIKATLEISVADNRRENTIETVEHYEIDSVWVYDTENNNRKVEFWSLLLSARLKHDYDPTRQVPVALRHPIELSHQIEVGLMEDWAIEDKAYVINSDQYRYSYECSSSNRGRKFSLSYNYQSLSDHVPVENYDAFARDREKMMAGMGYQIFKSENNPTASASNNTLLAIILIIILFGAGIAAFLLMRKIHQRYDPPAATWATGERKIGGVLILPALGLLLTPLIYLARYLMIWIDGDLAALAHFADSSDSLYNPALSLLILLELLGDIFLFAFSILCIIHFFGRRTSVPRLMVFFYATHLLFFLLLSGLGKLAAPLDYSDNYQTVIIQLISAMIWIPYFLIADRVKETFNRRSRQNQAKDQLVVKTL